MSMQPEKGSVNYPNMRSLIGALDHIAKTAALSRTSTRRLRWIESRARLAIEGRPYSDLMIDLPKDGGQNTAEKLSKKLYEMKCQRDELIKALQKIAGYELPDEADAKIAQEVLERLQEKAVGGGA